MKLKPTSIKDPKAITYIAIIIGFALILVNFTFFQVYPQLFAALNMIAALIILGWPIGYKYKEYKKIREIEFIFPRFLADINENINSGMTLPQAIRATKRIDYGVLTPYVKDIIHKLEWGINFEKILQNFAKKVKSPVIMRTVRTINEAHRSGGKIGTVLEAVSSSIQEVGRIKKERKTRIYSQMINGYIIFVIFLGVMIALSQFVIPAFQWEAASDIGPLFTQIFRNLVIIQGFFSGLAIGKMAEGSFIEGLKHSLILVAMGYTIFIFFV